MVARWAIFGPDERELIDLQKSEYRGIVKDDSYKELVMAYSRLVDRMCRDIANTLKNEMARS